MAASNTKLRIVALPGDGIGREILAPTFAILARIERALGGFTLDVDEQQFSF